MAAVERDRSQELRVGAFVLGFLLLIAAATFVLGGGSSVLAERYVLHTRYTDVKGMKVGAVVRLAGVDVGEVSRVSFSPDLGSREIDVELTIEKEFQERIREGSVASIQQIGVLGDMYVGVTVGSVDKALLQDGAFIAPGEAPGLADYAETATDIVANARSISRKVDLMLGTDDAAQRAQIAKSIENVGLLLEEARNGRGAIHALIYDPHGAARIRSILDNVDRATADLAATTSQLRHGDGVAHELVYGKGGAKLTASVDEAAGAVSKLLADLEGRDSLAHALLYDPARARMVEDLQAAAASLRAVSASVADGEGSLGLLVRDPALYEDVRALLGGAQRNALLRAYIRATIASQKGEQAAPWAEPVAPAEKK
jgi:phospholipid/cholesterol/gamma-HCH transport system substrate-binding protein